MQIQYGTFYGLLFDINLQDYRLEREIETSLKRILTSSKISRISRGEIFIEINGFEKPLLIQIATDHQNVAKVLKYTTPKDNLKDADDLHNILACIKSLDIAESLEHDLITKNNFQVRMGNPPTGARLRKILNGKYQENIKEIFEKITDEPKEVDVKTYKTLLLFS